MKTKAVSGIMLTLLLISMLTLAFNIQAAIASGTIYIRADGSVDPPDAPISSIDNITYTLTDNIVVDVPEWSSAIVVERNVIVVDGAGYTLQGTEARESRGIDLTGRSNVTIKNMEIKAFSYGIWLVDSSNNSICGNTVTNNDYGIILLFCSNNSIYGNNITNNDYGNMLDFSSNNNISRNNITNNTNGIRVYNSSDNIISGNNITNNTNGILLSRSSNNTLCGNNVANNDKGIYPYYSYNNLIYHNDFINNGQQVDIFESTNTWDDGYPFGGNYWSDYTGVDFYNGPYQNETGSDGIGDTPYIIVDLYDYDWDNYPLMSPWASPVEEVPPPSPFWTKWWFWTIVIAVILTLAGTVYFLKKRKPPTPTAPTLPTEGIT